jgi:hypothetical protein
MVIYIYIYIYVYILTYVPTSQSCVKNIFGKVNKLPLKLHLKCYKPNSPEMFGVNL